ncbi:MAG: glycoside hydrolase family 15 protein [Acidimicrobiia bacterium]|nr:glycoside hydrolase family 15 protein [Acidimicrobiia bacterium]
MPLPIEDYAFLSDTASAALVGKDGSIDWLAFPRFDSPASFAALLGTPDNGRWLLAPAGGVRSVSRRYRDGTLVLETVFTTDEGEVAVIDCMPPRDDQLDVVRLVQGRRGRVTMRTELIVRFDYGSVVPWVRRIDGAWTAVAGPDALRLVTPIPLTGVDHRSEATFGVGAGEEVPFVMTWHPSEERCHAGHDDAARSIDQAERWWRRWADRSTYAGEWAEEVQGSLVVLKGLTYGPTGGLVAAATTSLPEELGGARNWDYRFCWLRDATFTLHSLLVSGYLEEARAWREWLLRAVAGDPAELQIMYGLGGERRLPEWEVPWLAGYEGSPPVRVGNAASTQFQLDVYGEVLDSLHTAAVAGLAADDDGWSLQRAMLDFVEGAWMQPDEGIWEVRGPRQDFTHSKVMAWVAVDRAIRSAQRSGLDAPLDRWKALRAEIHAWVLANCVDDRGVFVQYPGTAELDASLLVLALDNFLPPIDPRIVATVEAVQRELGTGDFIHRYRTSAGVDGLPPGEGAFLLCSFWMADALHLIGRPDEARAMFDRLLTLRNDVGLLPEMIDPATGRFLGNTPQAFSHTGLVRAATLLSRVPRPGVDEDLPLSGTSPS